MKNTTNLLILNLAVADLLFLLVCVPATASDYILMYWPFGLTWCRTVQYIIYVTAYVSIYTLVLMAGDRSVLTYDVMVTIPIIPVARFLAVVFPVSSLTLRTVSNAKTLILATWVTITGCSVPIWMTHNVLQIDNGKCLDFEYVKYFI